MLNVIVLISGSGSNLRALLDAASGEPTDGDFRVTGVAADTDALGLAHAARAGVPTAIVRPRDHADRADWGRALAVQLRRFGADPAASEPYLIVSAGLMRILPPDFVREFQPHLINTHPALLPAFPGAHAVRDALAAGVDRTGCSVHVIDEGVDTGPVLRQATVTVRAGETEAELHERIKQLERPLLVDTVRRIARGDIDLEAVHRARQAPAAAG